MVSYCGNVTKKNAVHSGLQYTDTGSVKITFKEYEHNFGKVAEGQKIGYIFTFKNEGSGSLVIASATTSCGCTVPKYDSKPIPPGGNGDLEVVFDTSGRNGIQTKTITVKSNASTPVVLLKIIAEVVTNNN
jgi:hypothetical protein